MSRWTHIIIHHSGTRDSETMSWDNIKDYHVNTLGWDDVGYHFGIEDIEGTPQILLGRPLYKSGAHCIGYNHNALGFMFCGNWNNDFLAMPNDILNLAAEHIAGLCVVLKLSVSNIMPHNYADTRRTCPGKYFPFQLLISKVINILNNLP